jgi:hypothetical protein
MTTTTSSPPKMDHGPNGLRKQIGDITNTVQLEAMRAQKMTRANTVYKVVKVALTMTFLLLSFWAAIPSLTGWPALGAFFIAFFALTDASDSENEAEHIQQRIRVLTDHFGAHDYK